MCNFIYFTIFNQNDVTLVRAVIYCRIIHCSFPLPLYALCVRIKILYKFLHFILIHVKLYFYYQYLFLEDASDRRLSLASIR